MMIDSFYNSNPNLRLKILRQLISKFRGYIAGAEIQNDFSVFGGSEIQKQISDLTSNQNFAALVEKFKNQNILTDIERQIVEKFQSGTYGSYCTHDLLCNPSIYSDLTLNPLTETNYDVIKKGGMVDALSVIAGNVRHGSVFPDIGLTHKVLASNTLLNWSMQDVCNHYEYDYNRVLTKEYFDSLPQHVKKAIVEDFNNANQGIEEYKKTKEVQEKKEKAGLPDIDMFIRPEENTDYVYKLAGGKWYTRKKDNKDWISLSGDKYKKSRDRLNKSYKKQLAKAETKEKKPTLKKEAAAQTENLYTIQTFSGYLSNNPQRMPHYAVSAKKKVPAAVNQTLTDLSKETEYPNMTSFIFRKPTHNRGSRNDNYLSVFFGAVSPLELSRCTPYLSLTFYTKQNKGIPASNKMDSVGFMRFDDGKTGTFGKVPNVEKMFEGKVNSFIGENEEIASVNYMDMFLSPQTLVNANVNKNNNRSFNDLLNFENNNDELIDDLNNPLDPFAPMLTLKSFNATINSGGDYMITNRRAKLSMTLHDRSRLNEIAPFVSLSQVARTLVKIEHGWSHPDGNLVTSKNDIGKFLNTLRESHIYMLTSSDFSFSGNQIDINMVLDFWGATDFKSVHVSEGNYKDATDLKSKIIDVISDMEQNNIIKSKSTGNNHHLQQIAPAKSKTPQRDQKIIAERNKRVMKHVKIIRNSVSASKILLPTRTVKRLVKKIDDYSVFSDKKEGDTPDTYWHAEILVEYLLALSEASLINLGKDGDKLYTGDPVALIDLLDSGNGSFIKSIQDLELKSKRNLAERLVAKIDSMTGSTLVKDEKDTSVVRRKFNTPDPFTSQLCNVYFDIGDKLGYYQRYPEGHVSLGKVISNLIALPLSATNNYDEVQILFYPVNNFSGGARKYTTASIPVEIKALKKQIYKVIESESDLTPRGVFDIISNYFQDNNLSIYGLSKDSFGVDVKEKEKEIRSEPEFDANVIKHFQSINPSAPIADLQIEQTVEKLDEKLSDEKEKKDKKGKKEKEASNRKKLKAAEKSYIKSRIDSIKSTSLKTDLEKIYKSDNLGPSNPTYFKKPVIHLELEVMPKIVPAPSQTANAGDIEKKAKTALNSNFNPSSEDILKVKGIDNNKKILKIHVYDENATSKPAETMFMDGLISPESFFPTAGILTKGIDEKSIDPTKIGVKKFKDAANAYISKMSIREIKQYVSRAFPTIRYGSQQSVVKSVSVSSNTSDEIVNARLMNALKKEEEANNSNITKNAENTEETVEEFIIPTSIDMAIYGCPFITMGLNVFVDMQTGTDLDNVYMVGDVTHNISAGEYSTNVSLFLPQIGTGRDMKSRLLAAVETVDKEKVEVAAAEVKQKIEEEKNPVSTAEADAQRTIDRANKAEKKVKPKKKTRKRRSKRKSKTVKQEQTEQNLEQSLPDDYVDYTDSTGRPITVSDVMDEVYK